MADKTAQLAKLSHMSQLPTSFFHTSGGSLIIRRRSRDPAVVTTNSPRPIARTRSCPAAQHGGENENESDCDCECESGNESSSSYSTTSSLTSSCSSKSNEAVRTRPGVQKLQFKQDEQQPQKRRSTLVCSTMPPVHIDRIERDITSAAHSGPVRTRSSRRNTWGSIMADEGGFILPVLDRDAMSTSSEDSGVESGVESARDERTATGAATVDNKRERRQKGRSLQLAHPPDAEIAPKAGGLRRSKENEDVQLPVRSDKDKAAKKDGKQKLLSTPKVMRLKLKDLHSEDAEGGGGEKAEKKKKREDSKREKRERKEIKAREKDQKKAEQKKDKATTLGSNSSGGKSRSESEEEDAGTGASVGGQHNQPITVRRTLKLNLEGLPASPRGGISVQSLLRVGDSVWAADSSGRITVFNAKGEVEKVIVVCTGRLYSLLLVNKKQVWVSAEDSVIRVYQADKYKKLKDLQSHRSMVRCMEVVRQPDDKVQVWSGDVEGNIIVWDTLKLKKDGELCVQYGEAIFCITALPHSVWASAGGEIYRVNIRKLEVETGWTAHERPITDLLYMQDENVVLSCAGDGIIRVWKDHYSGMDNHSSLQSEASLRPASLLRELTSSTNVSALCPASPRSGLRICAGHIDGAISLWDSDMNEVARVKCEGSDFAGIRYLLSIRPDEGKASRKLGETLWSATRDGSICVWDWAPQ